MLYEFIIECLIRDKLPFKLSGATIIEFSPKLSQYWLGCLIKLSNKSCDIAQKWVEKPGKTSNFNIFFSRKNKQLDY